MSCPFDFLTVTRALSPSSHSLKRCTFLAPGEKYSVFRGSGFGVRGSDVECCCGDPELHPIKLILACISRAIFARCFASSRLSLIPFMRLYSRVTILPVFFPIYFTALDKFFKAGTFYLWEQAYLLSYCLLSAGIWINLPENGFQPVYLFPGLSHL